MEQKVEINKTYLANAKQMAMEKFNNADGFIDDNLSFTGDDFFNAKEVQQAVQNPQTSQSYIQKTLVTFPLWI